MTHKMVQCRSRAEGCKLARRTAIPLHRYCSKCFVCGHYVCDNRACSNSESYYHYGWQELCTACRQRYENERLSLPPDAQVTLRNETCFSDRSVLRLIQTAQRVAGTDLRLHVELDQPVASSTVGAGWVARSRSHLTEDRELLWVRSFYPGGKKEREAVRLYSVSVPQMLLSVIVRELKRGRPDDWRRPTRIGADCLLLNPRVSLAAHPGIARVERRLKKLRLEVLAKARARELRNAKARVVKLEAQLKVARNKVRSIAKRKGPT